MSIQKKHIRNCAIIAHIDHGKSTLADRFIQRCQGLAEREMQDRVLDSMDIERERGITIKAQSVSLFYTDRAGQQYQFNFIDTPGHVDFSYEVSRSLAACEGALLLVDASQGVEAQSVANCYAAIDQDMTIVPVLNKIDLPQADPERVQQEIEDIIGIDASQAVPCSAKQGTGIEDVLEALVQMIPPPAGQSDQPLRALIIDTWFDAYLGVISLVRIQDGQLRVGDSIAFCSIGKQHKVEQLGIFQPKRVTKDCLSNGEIGFVVAGVKDIHGAPVGDTIHHSKAEIVPLPGFRPVQPQVYAGLFPMESVGYELLRDALAKLSLNDASLVYETESSQALGSGFRCGFLGLLHMDIVQERLEREYQLNLLMTAPTVIYEVLTKQGDILRVDNPSELPEVFQIAEIREPILEVNILLPSDYVGQVIQLCMSRRGVQHNLQFLGKQVRLTYEIPASEVIGDFFDQLKSVTRGFASLEYSMKFFQAAPLIRLDLRIQGQVVDALAVIIHKDRARTHGYQLCQKILEFIPRQQFEVAIQAAIGNKIIARSTVKAVRKNVTAKCYGGDISRKKKLLQKQKAGKKRMKRIGNVDISQEAFREILKLDTE